MRTDEKSNFSNEALDKRVKGKPRFDRLYLEILGAMTSDSGHEMDALGHAGEEGRSRPRKNTVSCLTSVDPCVSEWGNPIEVNLYDP